MPQQHSGPRFEDLFLIAALLLGGRHRYGHGGGGQRHQPRRREEPRQRFMPTPKPRKVTPPKPTGPETHHDWEPDPLLLALVRAAPPGTVITVTKPGATPPERPATHGLAPYGLPVGPYRRTVLPRYEGPRQPLPPEEETPTASTPIPSVAAVPVAPPPPPPPVDPLAVMAQRIVADLRKTPFRLSLEEAQETVAAAPPQPGDTYERALTRILANRGKTRTH